MLSNFYVYSKELYRNFKSLFWRNNPRELILNTKMYKTDFYCTLKMVEIPNGIDVFYT